MLRSIATKAAAAAASLAALAACSSVERLSPFARDGGDDRPVVVVESPDSSGPVIYTPPQPVVVEQAIPIEDDPAPAAPIEVAQPAGPQQRQHRVVAGDTVYSLARRYGVTPADIQAANGLDAAFSISIDQVLTIPGAGGGGAPVAEAPAAPLDDGQPLAMGPSRPLVRPAEGPIVSEFRSPMGSALNDGVDIGAPAGAPVLAAADGTVAFVSDPTSPLGSVVLVQHPGGMTTIYGRLDGVTVRPGDSVTAGQQIARVVQPRDGGRPLLHFELRRGSEPIDPTPFL